MTHSSVIDSWINPKKGNKSWRTKDGKQRTAAKNNTSNQTASKYHPFLFKRKLSSEKKSKPQKIASIRSSSSGLYGLPSNNFLLDNQKQRKEKEEYFSSDFEKKAGCGKQTTNSKKMVPRAILDVLVPSSPNSMEFYQSPAKQNASNAGAGDVHGNYHLQSTETTSTSTFSTQEKTEETPQFKPSPELETPSIVEESEPEEENECSVSEISLKDGIETFDPLDDDLVSSNTDTDTCLLRKKALNVFQRFTGTRRDLQCFSKKAEELHGHKQQLEEKFNFLSNEYKSLLHRYRRLKKNTARGECGELEHPVDYCRRCTTYERNNNHLKSKMTELEKLLETNKQLEIRSKDYSLLKESNSKLVTEMERMKRDLFHEREKAKSFEELKRIDYMKDMEIIFLHNELIELKGSVRVLARFKPEKDCAFEFIGEDKVRILPSTSLRKDKPKLFTFHRVFAPSTSQVEVFEEVSPYVTSAMNGYNVCLLTYGQTGSGKTYTLEGTRHNPGIATRSIQQMLSQCQNRFTWEFSFLLSIVQVYNEIVMDLLGDNVSPVSLQDDGKLLLVRGLTEHTVRTERDFNDFITKGQRRRCTSDTLFNAQSSRSHFIILLRIQGRCANTNTETNGMLTLCDLAGFEKFSKLDHRSVKAVESKYIGKTLTALERVLEALKRKEKIVPYRDSKLTHLLKPSLSGESRCVLILTVSSRRHNLDGSLRTLLLGNKASHITLGKARKHTAAVVD